MDLARTWRHLVHSPRATRRAFPDDALSRIEHAVRASETMHSGEIRVAIEGALDLAALWKDVSPRERAIEVFTRLGVWNTVRNNGVLIYVLLADRDVEIVTDRGLTGLVPPSEWDRVCRSVEKEFSAGRFEPGLQNAVDDVGQILASRFPFEQGDRDELPDAPSLL